MPGRVLRRHGVDRQTERAAEVGDRAQRGNLLEAQQLAFQLRVAVLGAASDGPGWRTASAPGRRPGPGAGKASQGARKSNRPIARRSRASGAGTNPWLPRRRSPAKPAISAAWSAARSSSANAARSVAGGCASSASSSREAGVLSGSAPAGSRPCRADRRRPAGRGSSPPPAPAARSRASADGPPGCRCPRSKHRGAGGAGACGFHTNCRNARDSRSSRCIVARASWVRRIKPPAER